MNSEDNFDMKNAISGVLVIDKPVGMTSHDVVQVIRKGTNIDVQATPAHWIRAHPAS
jgi:tRNA pseudouridine55 synthase